MHTQVRWLACPADFNETWLAMQAFTQARDADTCDEVWLCEHAPVYTQGQAGRDAHLLNLSDIPLVRTDRGGQATYHGPGQVVAYCLVDLRRAGLYVRDYVRLLEDAAMQALAELGVKGACRMAGAPGVYVPGHAGALDKVAALGVKIRNGRSYHGLAMNLSMDLTPFAGIDPCGLAGMRVVDVATCTGAVPDLREAGDRLARAITGRLDGLRAHEGVERSYITAVRTHV